MITIENYFKKLKFIKLDVLPKKLQNGFYFTQEVTEEHKNWDFYKEDKEIKEKVDEYLMHLNEFLAGTPKAKITEEDAKEAAKELIRHYVHRGDSLDSLNKSMMGEHGSNFSASIKSGKIEVDEVKKEKVDYKFSLAKIYDEVSAEKKSTKQNGNVDAPVKKAVKKSVKKSVKAVKEPAPKASTRKTKSRQPKVKTSKSTENPKPVRVDYSKAHPVERIDEEIKFIKRFLSLHNRVKTKQQILNFVNALQRAILEKRIRKSSKYADEVMTIQRQLVSSVKVMGTQQKFTLNEKAIERLTKIAGSARIRFSIQYLKRFIGIRGKEITKEKAKTLYDLIVKAMDTDKVGKADPYLHRIKKVLNGLKQFIQVARKGETLEVHEEALNGLNGVLGCLCQEEKEEELNGIAEIVPNKPAGEVMSVEEARQKEYQPVHITGKWLDLIGKFCLPTQFFVYGLGGSGKSSFVLLFTQYLASLGFKILYVAGEQFDTPTFTAMLNKLNIVAGDHFKIVANLDSLNPAEYDFVVLDSKDQLEVNVDQFTALLEQYPKQSFIVLSQAVKSGSFTGKERWRNIVDVMIQAENGIIRTGHDKNRWGGAGEMMIFDHPSQYLKAG